MMKVYFYPLNTIADELLKFAVIVSRYKNKWLYCQHRLRDTWEIPGGKRNLGETILQTAHRELLEETGAVQYELISVCIYSVEGEVETFGLLCYAEITELAELLENEIGQVALFDEMPEALTYPEIQPKLFDKVMMEKALV